MGVPAQVATVATLLLSAGCVDTYRIPPVQLQYLNGYSIHSEQTTNGSTYTDMPYRLVDYSGQPVDYNSTKQLVLLGASDKPLAPPGPFDVILINDLTFDAVPLNGPPVQVPLQDIKAVEITQPSREKTTFALTLVTVVATLVVCGIAAAVH
jgi:hypothetical protein